MAYEDDEAESALAGFITMGIFAGIVQFVTLLAIIFHQRKMIGVLRLMMLLPFGLFGGFAMHLYHSLRERFGDSNVIPATEVWAHFGINAVVGVLLMAWALISAPWARTIRKRYDSVGARSGRRRSRGYFYMFIVDVILLAALIAGALQASNFVPFTVNQCGTSYRANLFTAIGRAVGEDRTLACRRAVFLRWMGIIAAWVSNFQSSISAAVDAPVTGYALSTIIFTQAILIFPRIALPGVLRPPLFFLIRGLRFLTWSRHQERYHRLDVEMGLMSFSDEKNKTLASLFRSDSVAGSLATFLHYDDIVNVSLTSKTMRRAVLSDEKGDVPARVDALCESTCSEHDKSECWGCGRVVCPGCMRYEYGVDQTRTAGHLKHCYAICTKCKLVRGFLHPPPLVATWRANDLSIQHGKCSASLVQKNPYGVTLCKQCAAIPKAAATAIRERREMEALQVSLKRRIRCNECDRALTKGARRWWICSAGDHECHWAGHEVH